MDEKTMIRKEWEALIEIRAQQGALLSSLKEITSDHEKRLRNLERIVGYGVGALALIKFALDYFSK